MKERNLQIFLLGNGETICDTSKIDKETNDYPIVAHISDVGTIDRCEKGLSDDEYKFIKGEAEKLRSKFYEDWDKLTIEQQYSRLLDNSDSTTFIHIFQESVEMTMEEKVTKYMPYVILKEGERPAVDTNYNRWITFINGRGESFFNDYESLENIKNAALTPSFGSVWTKGSTIEILMKANATEKDVRFLIEIAQGNNAYLNVPSARFISLKFGDDADNTNSSNVIDNDEIIIMLDSGRGR